jgi:hypothetical protein
MRKYNSFTLLAARWLLFCSSLAGTLASSRVAQAQTAQADRIQNVIFDDDLLHGDLGAPFGGPVFPSHLPPARTQLIRPRTNFLPELYKSVEHI